jgi:hypothetical protein
MSFLLSGRVAWRTRRPLKTAGGSDPFHRLFDFRVGAHCEEKMKEVWEGGEDAGNI